MLRGCVIEGGEDTAEHLGVGLRERGVCVCGGVIEVG